jgi:hypothetical protein
MASLAARTGGAPPVWAAYLGEFASRRLRRDLFNKPHDGATQWQDEWSDIARWPPNTLRV